MILNPAGMNVIDWADVMTGSLGFLSDPLGGTKTHYERIDDPEKWQDWA